MKKKRTPKDRYHERRRGKVPRCSQCGKPSVDRFRGRNLCRDCLIGGEDDREEMLHRALTIPLGGVEDRTLYAPGKGFGCAEIGRQCAAYLRGKGDPIIEQVDRRACNNRDSGGRFETPSTGS